MKTPRIQTQNLRRFAGVFTAVSAIGTLFAAPPPMMMGINLSAAAFGTEVLPGVHGQHYIYPTPAYLDYYKARGIELIRFPFRWERIQPVLNGPLDSAELGRLNAFLDAVEQRGMRVILDMHNYARCTVAGTSYIIGTPQVPRSAYQDVWEKIAAQVKDRDCLWGYGIMNEPYGMGTYTWKDSAQYAVNGIRNHDTRHTILLPGDQYSGAHWWLTHSTNLLTVTDPANNLMFEAHQYFDNTNEGKYDGSYDAEGATPHVGIQRIRAFVNWCQTNNVRGYIGEYGVPGADARWLTLLDNTLDYMAANQISGTYWAGGPMWDDYPLSTEPRVVHDEAPQMAALIEKGGGVGTNFWPSFTWYHDALVNGPQGSYTYNYKSATATLAVNFADTTAAFGSYGGAKGITFSYTVPSGGYAGAGRNITAGAALAPNFARGHKLSFQIRGSAGSSVRVFLQDATGAQSAKVNTASYITTSGTYQQVNIPLSAFITGTFTGTQRIERVAFEGLPADNVARSIQLDKFVFEKSDSTMPVATVASPGGASFAVDAPFQATATATDAGGVDFVEFLINGERLAIDETAPYAATLKLSETGSHRLTAIAYDMQGNPGRSIPVTLTGTAAVVRSLVASDTSSQTSFNSGLHWSDGLAPQAGINYVVDARDLRTPGTSSSYTFLGDSLTIKNGARLILRTTGAGVVTVGDLRFDGGAASLALNGTFTLAGGIALQAGGGELRSDVAGRTLTVNSLVGGPGRLTINLTGATDHVTLTNPANAYTGGTVVSQGILRAHAAGALGAGNVRVADGAGLRLASGATPDYIADGGTLIVGSTGTVELAFAGTEKIARLSLDGGSTYVAPGVWGAVGSGAASTSARLTGTGLFQVTSN